jgi:hypothetical protein
MNPSEAQWASPTSTKPYVGWNAPQTWIAFERASQSFHGLGRGTTATPYLESKYAENKSKPKPWFYEDFTLVVQEV